MPARPRRPLHASIVLERRAQMIQPEQVKNRSVNIAHMMRLIHRAQPDLIRRPDRLPALHPAARHPHREAPRIMVAPIFLGSLPRRNLRERSPPELAAPY